MSQRPQIQIPISRADKLADALSVLVLLAMWVGLAIVYARLPLQIPRHFDADGQVTAVGPREMIWLLPIVAGTIYLAMTLLNKYPHTFNYAEKVTVHNAPRLYTSTTRMMRWLKLMVLLVLGGVLLFTLKASLRQGLGLPAWFLPVGVSMVCAPFLAAVIRHFIRNFIRKKN